MRNPRKVLLKWIIYLIDKDIYKYLKRPGKCYGRYCDHNCCKKLLGFFRCPYLNKENLCKLELKNKKPFMCINAPTILDDMPNGCGFWGRNK